LRGIKDLIEKSTLKPEEEGGRSTNYVLKKNENDKNTRDNNLNSFFYLCSH